jgi:hypothetical protein
LLLSSDSVHSGDAPFQRCAALLALLIGKAKACCFVPSVRWLYWGMCRCTCTGYLIDGASQ